MWPFKRKSAAAAEERASIENPSVPISSTAILTLLAHATASSSGVSVNAEKAMEVPAVWAAVNFLSKSVAGLPLHLYRRDGDKRVRVDNALSRMFRDAPNPEMSSFRWRQGLMSDQLLHGRHYTYIERPDGRVVGLWPLDPTQVRVRRDQGRTFYDYTENRGGRPVTITYDASEILDLPWSLKFDKVSHRDPVSTLRNAIGLTIALEEYASRFFQNGGVPPLALQGPIATPTGAKAAADDVARSLVEASRDQRNVLVLPTGHELKDIGFEPENMQMVEVRRFQVEEVARIYSLPPVFLQDLTRSTFSNAEQQDLHLVKHTIKALIEPIEQEINLKLFGGNDARFVAFNVDGLLRGDFKTRMEGYARGIQTAVFTPNEARRKENLPDKPKGDDLLVQGATVPLGQQPVTPAAPAQQGDDDEQDGGN